MFMEAGGLSKFKIIRAKFFSGLVFISARIFMFHRVHPPKRFIVLPKRHITVSSVSQSDLPLISRH
uniref:Uncharacterized protein n=1 Tax=Astatotilapia calliptera TaxID=8154 RepID=A0AAX7V7D9_ASTCA